MEINDGLKRRLEFTYFKLIIVARDKNGADRIIKCDTCSSREEAIGRLKGRFDQFVSRIDTPVETKLLDIDNLCGAIKYNDGSSVYMDVEVNASLIDSDSPKQQITKKQVDSMMRLYSMVNERVRTIIVNHITELINGRECTLKLTYKEVDKRDDDGKYDGYNLYFADDVQIYEWVYEDLKGIFMEEK